MKAILAATFIITALPCGVAAQEATLTDQASSHLHDLFFEMQEMERFSVLYTGELMRTSGNAKFHGIFPFTGFYAVMHDSPGNQAKRFWLCQATVIRDVFEPNGQCIDELTKDGERWFSFMRSPARKFVQTEDPQYEYKFMVIDPRVSVFLLTTALTTGMGTQSNYWHYATSANIVSAKETLDGILVVMKTGGDSWTHCLLNRAQGYRPTMIAVTYSGAELKPEQANARHVNRMRWSKDGRGIWMPEAGDNVTYVGEKANANSFKAVSYRCLWLEEDELTKSTFERSDLDSNSGVRLSQMQDNILRVNKILKMGEVPRAATN